MVNLSITGSFVNDINIIVIIIVINDIINNNYFVNNVNKKQNMNSL